MTYKSKRKKLKRKRPSKHYRKIKTKKGIKIVLVNPRIPKRKNRSTARVKRRRIDEDFDEYVRLKKEDTLKTTKELLPTLSGRRLKQISKLSITNPDYDEDVWHQEIKKEMERRQKGGEELFNRLFR